MKKKREKKDKKIIRKIIREEYRNEDLRTEDVNSQLHYPQTEKNKSTGSLINGISKYEIF